MMMMIMIRQRNHGLTLSAAQSFLGQRILFAVCFVMIFIGAAVLLAVCCLMPYLSITSNHCALLTYLHSRDEAVAGRQAADSRDSLSMRLRRAGSLQTSEAQTAVDWTVVSCGRLDRRCPPRKNSQCTQHNDPRPSC